MAKKTEIRVFPTQYSESAEIGTFQTFRKPSMTEPDNAMSIPEIIARFTRGYGLQVESHPWTTGSALEEGEDFNDNENFFEEFMPAQQQAQVPAQQQAQVPAQQQAQVPAQQQAQEPAQEPSQQSEG